jgi:hypothetical protein
MNDIALVTVVIIWFVAGLSVGLVCAHAYHAGKNKDA